MVSWPFVLEKTTQIETKKQGRMAGTHPACCRNLYAGAAPTFLRLVTKDAGLLRPTLHTVNLVVRALGSGRGSGMIMPTPAVFVAYRIIARVIAMDPYSSSSFQPKGPHGRLPSEKDHASQEKSKYPCPYSHEPEGYGYLV